MVGKLIDFDIEKVSPSIIMVAGVGGGGSNAVNYMFEQGIAEVTFMICNTDRQALSRSPVPIKVKLGEKLTQGLGAGNNPERGRAAAVESLSEIVSVFEREGTKMVFITAGMGGGTGTGAAPVIAKAAKEMGILTVAIVTLPFHAEGKTRLKNALEGIEQLRPHVDSLLVINNENIQEIYGKLPLTEAFGKADDILSIAAKGIAEIITRDGVVNVDFADVRTVMSNSGVALMGSGRGSGDDRAQKVADLALNSPLLNHNYIKGAKNILLNITSGHDEITLEETYRITEYIQQCAGNEANIIWGAGYSQALGSDIEVTIIATGFDMNVNRSILLGEQDPVGGTAEDQQISASDSSVDSVPEGQSADTPRPRWKPPTESPDAKWKSTTDTPNPTWKPPTETPDAKWKPPTEASGSKWKPPVTPDGDPSGRHPHTPGTAHGSASGSGEKPVPGSQSGFVPPVRDNQTIRADKKSHFDNLDEIINSPAFVRRKVKLQESGEDGAKAAKVALKEEIPVADKPVKDSSLFD